ncbi:MAG: leucine-rich repeat domain-containing protein, partial [Muribaculaceae bacterium]|nr:leucine-rich repeat domain-containing protein [Muribaculaceae bacterium]
MKRFLFLLVSIITVTGVEAVKFTASPLDDGRSCCITGIEEDHATVSGDLSVPQSLYLNGKVYEVTTIAMGALNDFPYVTRVIIPASVTRIGQVSYQYEYFETGNFYNCPMLRDFYVGQTNPEFSHNGQGMLLAREGQYLLRCPQAVTLDGGTLTVPAQVQNICPGAFNGVSALVTLVFEHLKEIYYNGGINSCVNLSSIRVNKSDFFTATDGVLYHRQGRLISFPPKKMLGQFTLPQNITEIGYMAFANTFYLAEVNFNTKLNRIREYAFYRSNVKRVNVPGSVTEIGEHAFSEAPQLNSLTFRCGLNEIPAGMAAGCPKLEKVEYQKSSPLKIKAGAFKNCESLTDYPFTAASYLADSVFYNTGFTEVVYDAGKPAEDSYNSGYYIFGGCKNLKKMDFSAVDCNESSFVLPCKVGDGCTELTELILARDTYIAIPNAMQDDWYPFGKHCKLKNIHVYSFRKAQERPVFHWGNGGTVKPNIYVLRNGLGADAPAPTDNLCAGDQYTTVKPIYYYESVRPALSYSTGNATFYIPGGAMEFFSEALDAGAYVEEFYRFNPGSEPDGSLSVALKVVFPDMVKLESMKVNG